jgi:two-component system, NarL family, sensor histidine kinase DesK
MMTAARTAGAGPADGAGESQRATALVVTVLCLLAVAEAGFGTANGGPGEGLLVVALMVAPILYVVPVTRRVWARHQYWLLMVQVLLTCVPFVLFGRYFVAGPSGWLAGLVLLTLPAPASWLLVAALAAAEEAVRIGLVGLPYLPAPSAAIWVLVAFAINALVLFGLARLADLVATVHAARGELADAAITAERLRTADTLRLAMGDRLAAAAGQAAAALQAIGRSQAQARGHVAEAGSAARRALADVRRVIAWYPGSGEPEVAAAPAAGLVLAARLARTVLAVVLCALAVQNVNDVVIGRSSLAPASGWALAESIADTIPIVALQLRHSWPSQAGGRPRVWPVTLALQALLTYGMFPVLGWRALVMCGLLAGSVLLLAPGRRGAAGFAVVVASVPALWEVEPYPGLTLLEQIGGAVFLTALTAVLGLMVYGLSRLARLAVQLEALRGELARTAVLDERLRVARDTHDLLGLGLSAIALKADLISRLIGRDDARARAEIAEMARICAAARTDIRLVTGEADQLPLDTELTAARQLLVSAGIDVSAGIAAAPVPSAAGAVLVPVLREAVTNILRHSTAAHASIETVAGPGVVRLHVSNDGIGGQEGGGDRAGHGLANLTTRVEAAGGRLASHRADGRFDLVAEIPLSVSGDTKPAVTRPGAVPMPERPGTGT